MYIGASTDAMPTPMPPISRAQVSTWNLGRNRRIQGRDEQEHGRHDQDSACAQSGR